ncbi:GNAT family N-acetyltransferase [Luteimonas soli]|uniref:GNAT family N-acetyltransferase n=1 Tax=Luteimonas soli TaxID=1648966 RepID=A0ABV7XGV5_9GAMM
MNPTDIRIETDRLLLRPPRIEDFDGFAELQADAEATRFIGGHVTRAEAWRRFLWQPGAWLVQGFGMFGVVEKSGQWVGQIGPWKPEGWPGNEIGYSFHPRAWGKGYATEAGIAAVDWAFEHLGWDDIIHCIDPGNEASQRVAQRLGSRKLRSGRLPSPFEDTAVDIWGQTREQWCARSANA